jgi:hypothetical protein
MRTEPTVHVLILGELHLRELLTERVRQLQRALAESAKTGERPSARPSRNFNSGNISPDRETFSYL